MRRCATEPGSNRDSHLVDSFLEMMSAERGAGAMTHLGQVHGVAPVAP